MRDVNHRWPVYRIALIALLTFSVLCPHCAIAQSPRVEDVFDAAQIRRGLFVVVADDARLGIELAAAEPVLVLVAASPQQVAAVRAEVVEAGLHGRVTVAAVEGGRLPLIDNLAAVVVADLDAPPNIERGELMRVVRPLGKLHVKENGKWLTTEKPQPAGVDEWPQYHHDAAMTDRSGDTLAGILLEKRDGRLVNNPLPREDGGPGEHQWWVDRFDYDILFPGNQGLVFDYTQMGGYKMPYYGFTQAPVYAYRGHDFLHAGGTTAMQHRGGSRGGRRTEVSRFRKLDELKQIPHPHQVNRQMTVGAELLWTAPYHESDGTGLGGLAVAGDAVLVGFSVENRDHWRDRDEMPHRLRVLDYQTGQMRQDDLELPAKPVLHGVTASQGQVYVTCEDGSVVCFGGVK